MAIAHRPWAGQVAAALASVGVGVSLAAPAAVSVKEVAADGEDAFLAQLATARGSKVEEYVAVTGAGADNLSLPAYLEAHRSSLERQALDASLELAALRPAGDSPWAPWAAQV